MMLLDVKPESRAEDDPSILSFIVEGALLKNYSSYFLLLFVVFIGFVHDCAACAAIFYGACLPTAGCAAADEMMSCVDELIHLDCQDMSVCGNDCTLEDGDPVRTPVCQRWDYVHISCNFS